MPEPEPLADPPGRGRAVGWVAVIGTLGGLALLVAALAFSIVVDGSSMSPTVHDGDRVLLDPRRSGGDVERFDVVQARAGGQGVSVLKRVIALPGDEVAIRPAGAQRPLAVFVRPAGQEEWSRVGDTAWPPDVLSPPCCDEDGTSSEEVRVATVPAGHVFLLGDHLDASDDSRTFGWVALDQVGSPVLARLLPLGDAGRLTEVGSLEPAGSDHPEHGSAS